MRVTYTVEGGFAAIPGLAKPIAIESATLPSDQGGELERRVQAARFFDQPTRQDTPPPGAADYRTYVITVEDGNQSNTVRLIDPIQDVALRDLVQFLQALSRN